MLWETAMHRLIATLITLAYLIGPSANAAPSRVSETPPPADDAAAIMRWALTLDRTGWEYLGSADDGIYFVRQPVRTPNGHLDLQLRAEFYDHSQVGRISSSLAEFEIDCSTFTMRRLRNQMLADHNLAGAVLSADDKPTAWFEPPGKLIPAALTGACLDASPRSPRD